jgi:PAP2 superfamily
MWLPWEFAAIGALIVGVGGLALNGRDDRWGAFGAVLREVAIVASLYSLWQLAGHLSVVHLEGAMGRAEWLWDVERALFLPDEAEWQRAILDHPLLVQASNIYYGGAHVPGMGAFLVWMFFWHRDQYRPWRNAIAWLTAVCLVIQLVPVAPPRFVSSLGIVDTGVLYGQSVYSAFGSTVAGQLQAMPSLHAGWAVLIGIAAARVGRGPWRWIGAAHAVATMYVIVVTGNHFWADGIVAAAILAVILVLQRRLAERSATAAPDAPTPALESAPAAVFTSDQRSVDLT